MSTPRYRVSILMLVIAMMIAWTPGAFAAEEDPRDTIYPAVDLGGREITVAMWWDYWPNSDSAEPTPADADFTEGRLEMYKSMRRIEEKYNVKIRPKNVPYAEIGAALTTAYLAGEPLADIVYLHGNEMIIASVNKRVLPVSAYAVSDKLDINSAEAIYTRRAPVGGDVFSFNGSGLVNSAVTMGYNKTITDALGLGDPLELYLAGEWTWDKFLEIAKAATKDLNGDGVFDQFGYVGFAPEMFTSFLYSNGAYVWDFDDASTGLDKPEAARALDWIAQLNYEHKIMKNAAEPWNDMARVSWQEGDVAFWEFQTYTAPEAPLPFDWHVISHPKGPDNTGEYLGDISTLADGYCIPMYVKDPEIVYQIWEDLNDAVHGRSLEEKLEVAWDQMYMRYPTVEDAERQVDISTNHSRPNNNGAIGLTWLDVIDKLFGGENSAAAVIESLMPQWQTQIDAFYNPPSN